MYEDCNSLQLVFFQFKSHRIFQLEESERATFHLGANYQLPLSNNRNPSVVNLGWTRHQIAYVGCATPVKIGRQMDARIDALAACKAVPRSADYAMVEMTLDPRVSVLAAEGTGQHHYLHV